MKSWARQVTRSAESLLKRRLTGLLALSLAGACATAGGAQSIGGLATPAGGEPVSLKLPAAALGQQDLAPMSKALDLEALRGKVVLLDFWATWCEPCKRTLPRNQALVHANAARGLVGYAISVDEDAAEIPSFLEALQIDLPVALDSGGVAADKLGANLLPYVLLLDRRGAVRLRATGADPALEKQIAATIAQLLAEP